MIIAVILFALALVLELLAYLLIAERLQQTQCSCKTLHFCQFAYYYIQRTKSNGRKRRNLFVNCEAVIWRAQVSWKIMARQLLIDLSIFVYMYICGKMMIQHESAAAVYCVTILTAGLNSLQISAAVCEKMLNEPTNFQSKKKLLK